MPTIYAGSTVEPTKNQEATISHLVSRVVSMGGVLSYRPSCASIGKPEEVVFNDHVTGLRVWRCRPAFRSGVARAWVVGHWAILCVGGRSEAEALEVRLQQQWPSLVRELALASEHLEASNLQ